MGFVMLALGAGTATGINAALLQSFNHGILSAALFLIAGVLYDRTHSRLMDDYKGLWKKMPAYTFFVLLIFFASLGLPGLNAFVSEFLALSSAFESTHIQTGWAMLAVTGIILGAAYFLRAYQRMFMGAYALKQPEWDEVLKDLTPREWVMLSIPAVLALIGGIRPDWFLGLYAEETTQWFQMLSLSKP
jgi:NADH-quinone oxidoreductase subunit M